MTLNQQQDQQDSVKTLSDLRLQIGEPVRIEVKAPRGRYNAKLLGYAENAGVFISAPVSGASGTPAFITEGSMVTLRMITGNRICSFQSKILKEHDAPFSHWLLSYPRELDLKLIRRHTRVPVKLIVSVDDHDEMAEHTVLPCSALCVDMSLGGVCLQLPRAIGKVGDQFYLTTRVQIGDVEQVLLAPVELCNQHSAGEEIGEIYNHGYKFLELDEDTRLIIAAFVYQQFLIETGNLGRSGQEL